MKSIAATIVALMFLLAGAPALAERTIAFAPYAIPETGTIALAVQQDGVV